MFSTGNNWWLEIFIAHALSTGYSVNVNVSALQLCQYMKGGGEDPVFIIFVIIKWGNYIQ